MILMKNSEAEVTEMQLKEELKEALSRLQWNHDRVRNVFHIGKEALGELWQRLESANLIGEGGLVNLGKDNGSVIAADFGLQSLIRHKAYLSNHPVIGG